MLGPWRDQTRTILHSPLPLVIGPFQIELVAQILTYCRSHKPQRLATCTCKQHGPQPILLQGLRPKSHDEFLPDPSSNEAEMLFMPAAAALCAMDEHQ